MSGMLTNVDYDRLAYMSQRPQYRGVHSEHLTALAQQIQQFEVIAPDRVPKTLVTMNSRVKVKDIETGETDVYTLVYPEEANVELGRVSAISPLGRALLGHRAGETVEVHAPMGTREMKIVKVLYQPEAAGHYQL